MSVYTKREFFSNNIFVYIYISKLITVHYDQSNLMCWVHKNISTLHNNIKTGSVNSESERYLSYKKNHFQNEGKAQLQINLLLHCHVLFI